MQFLLRQYDKHASQGKQSMKRLVRQNRGVTNVEIQKTGIQDFDRYAKRYPIDYSIQKDLSCKPPRYLIYIKAQDTDALKAAFKEYSASVLDKTKRPSVPVSYTHLDVYKRQLCRRCRIHWAVPIKRPPSCCENWKSTA